MTTNAEARLAEARDNIWLGEVAALEPVLRLRRQTITLRRRSNSTELDTNMRWPTIVSVS
jgi:hypothetical protein